MNDDLERVFRQGSSVSYISGRRGSGKTDFGHLLLETGYRKGIFDHIASNVAMKEGYESNPIPIEHICYFDRLQDWLDLPGRKAFLIDELGKHLYRMSFMGKKSKLILQVCQLCRKFDAHLIGIAPNEQFVNKLFFNTDILDVFMRKLSRKKGVIQNYVTRKSYMIYNIPRTKIPFLSKDIAIFDLADPQRADEEFDKLPNYAKAGWLYIEHRSLRKVATILKVSHTQVASYLDTCLKKRALHL